MVHRVDQTRSGGRTRFRIESRSGEDFCEVDKLGSFKELYRAEIGKRPKRQLSKAPELIGVVTLELTWLKGLAGRLKFDESPCVTAWARESKVGSPDPRSPELWKNGWRGRTQFGENFSDEIAKPWRYEKLQRRPTSGRIRVRGSVSSDGLCECSH